MSIQRLAEVGSQGVLNPFVEIWTLSSPYLSRRQEGALKNFKQENLERSHTSGRIEG